ncbi:SDR family oxidoreductase [Cyanobium sp. WAJ14-Wanaka]|uniref:SDR family oxidoreductase n=1 Tax=Cyanobium sp. WAJ14-Wanaka TaxID=2823725 RepID=UPI0020CB86EF|nr:SDR family oxidoreductase [Cyanobium sp. WAJ14-Wanaka]MCP9774781.1 SDR family oxidoreductase [Cyanobium sp. WAJ14-Wanaka]
MPVALITGASRGIGAAAAAGFAKAGYDLLLLSRPGPDGLPSPELEAVANALRTQGRRVETAGIDLADAGSTEAAMAELLQRGLLPNVVINNAGAAYTGPLAAMDLARWQWLLQLNLTAIFQVCQAVIPGMRQAGAGLIINVSSHAAHNTFPDWGAYGASKAALVSFSRCLAAEERAHGIRVCTLTLGAVNTPLWDSETVNSSFDRRAMLDPGQVTEALLVLAQQPSNQVIEDLTLMPAVGAL